MLAGASEVFDQRRGRKIQEEAFEQDKERLERKIGQRVVRPVPLAPHPGSALSDPG